MGKGRGTGGMPIGWGGGTEWPAGGRKVGGGGGGGGGVGGM